VGGGELANHGDHVGVGSQGAVGSGGEEGHVEERREEVPLIRRFLNSPFVSIEVTGVFR
jgi:hypothetical protein